jgi:hypothetical protein
MATWKKVIMENSAAALGSLTLTTDLAVLHGGTGASDAAGARSNLGLGSAATEAASAFATAAQGTLAAAALPEASVDADIKTLSLPASTTITAYGATLVDDADASTARTTLGLAGGNAGEFLKHDGTFGTPSYSSGQRTQEEIEDFAAGLITGGTHTGVTATYADASGTLSLGVDGALQDLDTLGAVASNGQMIVGTGAGAFAYESGATLRTSIGVDASGTDNSTNVTLANTNYLSISGQAITGGTVPITSGGTGATSAGAARTALGVVNNVNPTQDSTVSDVVSFASNELQAVDPGSNADHFVIWDDSESSLGYVSPNPARTLLNINNVNNTSDATKPLSDAAVTEFATKADLAGPTFTGTVGAAAVTTTGNVIVGGNLTVSGTTTTVNTETIDLADNFINLNSNASGTPSEDAGISVDRGSSADANLFWDEGIERWSLSLANLGGSDTASTPDAFVSAVYASTSAPSGNPSYGGTSGHGNMHVKTDTGDVYIYA